MTITSEYQLTIYDDTTGDRTVIKPDEDLLGLFVIERFESGEKVARIVLPAETIKALAAGLVKVVDLNKPSFNAKVLEGLVYPQASPFPLGR